MNRPARRDGTPDNNRDRGASRGAPRDDRRGAPRRDSRDAPRGDGRGAPRGEYRGGDARGGDSRGGDARGRSAPRGGEYRGNDSRGNDSRGGEYRGGSARGEHRGADNRGGAPRGDARGGAPRGDGRGGPRPDSRGGAPRGGDFRGAPRQDSRGGAPRGGAPRGGAPRGDGRGDSRGGSGYPRQGGPQQGGPRKPWQGAAKPLSEKEAAKRANKPQKKAPVKATLSFAKPARYQGEGPAATSFLHDTDANAEGMRLQKVLAQAGVASRRAAEQLIDEGRVEVDGEIIRHQGKRINPMESVVRVDGVRIVMDQEKVYLALNKPKGWQSTMSDDMGRPCIGDIVAERVMAGQRLFHVGRLDAETEGLILLTNDGELAHRLMHPSFEIKKTYMATVDGIVPKGLERQMKDGVELEDGPVQVDKFELLEVFEGRSLVRVILHEGRKHIVRRLLDEVGFPVMQLVRTDVGPVSLAEQRPGSLRVLGRGEISNLYDAVGL